MAERVLITGGAGFIGSHLGRELLEYGYRVRALDDLNPQVHGNKNPPAYLDDDVELVVGDCRDEAAVSSALRDVDLVVHLAARVGVGQSMYEISDYTSVNDVGTAVLLQAMLKDRPERLVVASSMSVYGEGLYRTREGNDVSISQRSKDDLRSRRWEPVGPSGDPVEPVPTPEDKPVDLSSIYALNKYNQERMCLLFGQAYDVPAIALRFFNVYGPHQALSNPYTGVLAIFASRLLNDRHPLIFEDGEQRRDFVSVRDIARACRLALEKPAAEGVVNIGSGSGHTVRDVARMLAEVLGKEHIQPDVTHKYRVGDIRHCFADVSRARDVLGYEPEVDLEKGMVDLGHWLEGQLADDRVDDAAGELARRGLTL